MGTIVNMALKRSILFCLGSYVQKIQIRLDFLSFVGLNYKKDIGPEVVEASGNYEPPADCSILGREVEFSCYIVGTGTVIKIKTKNQSQSINNNNFIKSLA